MKLLVSIFGWIIGALVFFWIVGALMSTKHNVIGVLLTFAAGILVIFLIAGKKKKTDSDNK